MPSRAILPIHAEDHGIGGPDPIPAPWARASKSYSSTVQSIPNNSLTDVVFDTYHNIAEGESGFGYFDSDSPVNTSMPILVPGQCLVKVCVIWNVTNVGKFRFGISKNVGTTEWHYGDTNHMAGGDLEFYATELMHLDIGLALSLTLHQASGSAKALDAAFLHVSRFAGYLGDDWDAFDPDEP